MYEVKWIKGEVDGRVGLICPYNEQFQSELKAVTSSAKFTRHNSAWNFDEEQREYVMPLVDKFYTNTARYRLEFDLKSEDDVSIDGASLMYITRDYWNWRRDAAVNFRVIEADISSGGSRNHPHVSGKLVIEADLREGAIISPEPTSIELAGEQEVINPLANYAVSELAAELARREETTAAMLKDADVLAELKKRGFVLFDKDQIYAAMKASLDQMYPHQESDKLPEEEKPLFRKLNQFAGLLRSNLDKGD
jgi:hypothetical protein